MAEKTISQHRGKVVGRVVTLGLQVAALTLLVLLLLKAIFDVDTHFDSWWYHLPWAARLAGLLPADAYIFEPLSAVRFEGFPLLAEFLQGFLWRVTGRVESANLVSFTSLVAFVVLLRYYFGVAWWLSVLALLAVPLVQAQAASTYIDLIPNLALAALVLLIFLAYVRKEVVNGKYLALIAISAFVAANTKLQIMPLVALALVFSVYPIIAFVRRKSRESGEATHLVAYVLVAMIALAAVFFVPLKNLMQHGNPVYPVKVEVFGTVLNYKESASISSIGGEDSRSGLSRPVEWFYSVFEVGMGPIFNVSRWSIDATAPQDSPTIGHRQGGLFGIYVVFHLLLFAVLLVWAKPRQRRVAIALVALVVVAAALMPASALLRYYMFWFICLISLNLFFIASLRQDMVQWMAGAVFLVFVLIVVDATDQNFIHPYFHSAQELLAERVDPRILQEATSAGNACLALERANQPFLYAPIWHPGTTYAVKAGPFFASDRREVEKVCDGWEIIYSTPVGAVDSPVQALK